MSDAAILTLMSGVVTISTMLVGFFTLWIKLRYGAIKAEEAASAATLAVTTAETSAKVVETKIDQNTVITSQAKDAATKASEHTTVCDGERERTLLSLTDHDKRITALEAQMASMKVSIDGVNKNVDSSRHEMRGHLQTIMNKIDLTVMVKPLVQVPTIIPSVHENK